MPYDGYVKPASGDILNIRVLDSRVVGGWGDSQVPPCFWGMSSHVSALSNSTNQSISYVDGMTKNTW
jgi:hypothetical protein